LQTRIQHSVDVADSKRHTLHALRAAIIVQVDVEVAARVIRTAATGNQSVTLDPEIGERIASAIKPRGQTEREREHLSILS
jgi:hypothetical protein